MKNYSILNNLIGEQLSSVEFVQDYLQLHFDGKDLTLYIWPTVQVKNELYDLHHIEFRNRLCSLISLIVVDVFLVEKTELTILFSDNQAIKVNLSSNNPNIVSEIGIFNDTIDKEWLVFE
jgi:hypothetical protein